MKNNEATVKSEGDKILDHVRKRIAAITTDEDEKFLINRWVYARLQNDERRTKDALRKELLQENKPCPVCNIPFNPEGKNIHLHRLEENRRYIKGNCVLAHQECHHSLQEKK